MPEAQVLVAAGSEDVRKQIDGFLSGWQVGVRYVSNGRETVELAESGVFDLIIMTPMIGETNCCQATLSIRSSKEPSVKNLPIIALVDEKSWLEHSERCLKAGVNKVLHEPIEGPLLINTMAVWIPLAKHIKTPTDIPCNKGSFPAPLDPERFPDVLPGLAFKKTLQNLGGEMDLYLELLQQYVLEKSDVCTHIRQNLANGDIVKATVLVHGMRGVAGNLGINKLSAICSDLEKTLQKEDSSQIFTLLDCMDAEQAVVLRSLEFVLQATGSGAPEPPS